LFLRAVLGGFAKLSLKFPVQLFVWQMGPQQRPGGHNLGGRNAPSLREESELAERNLAKSMVSMAEKERVPWRLEAEETAC